MLEKLDHSSVDCPTFWLRQIASLWCCWTCSSVPWVSCKLGVGPQGLLNADSIFQAWITWITIIVVLCIPVTSVTSEGMLICGFSFWLLRIWFLSPLFVVLWSAKPDPGVGPPESPLSQQLWDWHPWRHSGCFTGHGEWSQSQFPGPQLPVLFSFPKLLCLRIPQWQVLSSHLPRHSCPLLLYERKMHSCLGSLSLGSNISTHRRRDPWHVGARVEIVKDLNHWSLDTNPLAIQRLSRPLNQIVSREIL